MSGFKTKRVIEMMHEELHAKIKAAKDARAAGNLDGAMAKLDACDALAEKIAEARRTAVAPKASRTVALATQIIDVLDSEPERMHAVLIRQLCATGIEAEGEVFAVEHGTATVSPSFAERKAIELLGLINMLPDSTPKRVCVVVASNLARRLRCMVVKGGSEVSNG